MANEIPGLVGLPFEEAIEYFQGKVNLPTERWTDLDKGMHARAFVVAGAQKAELLTGLREQIDSALTKGTTFQDFKKRFNQLAAEHQWKHTGTPDWRARVIYETNIRTAYQAGRYKQMTDPEVLEARPYWQYFHGNSMVPREAHQRWDGKVLPATDPWWHEHYPPNGWGCKCTVHSLSQEELDLLPKEQREIWQDPPKKPVDKLDEEWRYNVGKSAWGEDWATRLDKRGPFVEERPWDPSKYPWLAKDPPAKPLPVPLGPKLHSVEGLREALPQGTFVDKLGETINVTDVVVDHILKKPKRWDGREQFFPLIPHILKDPEEVWVGFLKHDSGLFSIRRRYFVRYMTPTGQSNAGVLVDVIDNQLTAFDVFFGSSPSGGNLRSGRLLYPWPEKT